MSRNDNQVLNKVVVARVVRELWPENRLVVLVALHCRLYLNRVLRLTPSNIDGDGLTVDGVHYPLPVAVLAALRRISDAYYIFPHRDYSGRHRTKQAIYTDFRRACRQLGYGRVTPRHLLRYLT